MTWINPCDLKGFPTDTYMYLKSIYEFLVTGRSKKSHPSQVNMLFTKVGQGWLSSLWEVLSNALSNANWQCTSTYSDAIGQLRNSYEVILTSIIISYFYTSSCICNTWLRPILVLPSGVFVMNTSSWWMLSFSSILIVLVVPHGRPRVILLPSLEPRLLWFLCKFPKCFWKTIKMVRD